MLNGPDSTLPSEKLTWQRRTQQQQPAGLHAGGGLVARTTIGLTDMADPHISENAGAKPVWFGRNDHVFKT